MKKQIIGGFILGSGLIVLVVGLSAIMALPVMWLWNALIPEIIGLKTLTFMQSWGVCILTGLLFKSHGISTSK
jgi:hypothetical protein